jgi:hypothetical protein
MDLTGATFRLGTPTGFNLRRSDSIEMVKAIWAEQSSGTLVGKGKASGQNQLTIAMLLAHNLCSFFA